MNTDQMRMVLALAKSGSMTTTAKRLQLTQPALTYQLKKIESELGFKVFHRDRTGTSLTPEGVFFCEELAKVLAEYDESVRLSRAMAKGVSKGNIRVGTNMHSRDIVTAFLRATQGLPDSANISLVPCGTSDPIALLEEGVIDFWSASDAACEKLSNTLVGFFPMSNASNMVYVPLSHPLAARESIGLEELSGETIWLWPEGGPSRASDTLRKRLLQLATPADIQDFSAEASTMLALVADGTLAIYDNGFLPPPSHLAKPVPLKQEYSDILGLVYLRQNEENLSGIMRTLEEQLSAYKEGGTVAGALVASSIATILDDIVETIRKGGMRDVLPLVDYALELGAPASHILNRGVLAGMDEASRVFRNGESYTSEYLAAVATSRIASEELRIILEEEESGGRLGTAVIGTLVGDRHELGKNLVRIALEGRGIDVHDLGSQVTPRAFADYLADNPSCNVALISISTDAVRKHARETMRILELEGLRDRVYVMLGGSAANPGFASDIGADAYTEDAEDAAQTAFRFLSY